MDLAHTEVPISSDFVEKWQRLVDLLAAIVSVPSAVVCKLDPPDYTQYNVVAASGSSGNPFQVKDTFSMDIGTFCEAVIKTRQQLLVINALEDDKWSKAPEIGYGMISYLGLPVAWPDGRMFGTICVLDDKSNQYNQNYQTLLEHCRDVLEADLQTAVRQAQELEGQRSQLSELFERVPEGIVMINSDLSILRLNSSFTKIFGYSSEEAIGRSITDLVVPDDLGEEAEALLRKMFRSEEAYSVEARRKRKDGTIVPVSIVSVPLSSDDSGKAGYLIYRDMTDSKRLEEQQRRHHEIELELAHLNRIATLGQLSASIAHELNQPLTGIITNCDACLQLLMDNPRHLEAAQEAVRRAMRDGDRAAEVVRRLRALFSNKELTLEDVDLNAAAQEVLALSAGEIRAGRAILRTEFASDLPSVLADRVQLQQVVLNLLLNALDAMSTVNDRNRDLLIRTEREGEDWVRLSVQDAGSGFALDNSDKLFDAFYSTKDSGMGLGLAVSRSIIESHNGRLSAALNNGHGATFSFCVPVDPASSAELRPRESIEPMRIGSLGTVTSH